MLRDKNINKNQTPDEGICGQSIKCWRDENQVHHVPKRSLEELIINEIN